MITLPPWFFVGLTVWVSRQLARCRVASGPPLVRLVAYPAVVRAVSTAAADFALHQQVLVFCHNSGLGGGADKSTKSRKCWRSPFRLWAALGIPAACW